VKNFQYFDKKVIKNSASVKKFNTQRNFNNFSNKIPKFIQKLNEFF